MDGARALGEAGEAGQDLVRRFSPNEGLGIFVVHIDVFADGGFQLSHATERAASDSLVGDFGEPAFHQVHPGTIGGKVNMKSWAFGEPFPEERCLVGAVVIHDDMYLHSGGHVRLDPLQEWANFRGAMAAVELADHAAGLPFQSGK